MQIYIYIYTNFIIIVFLPTSTKLQALHIILGKVWLQRRLIGVKVVEEGDQISPSEGYWQLLK